MFVLLALLALNGCNQQKASTTKTILTGKIRVAVVNYPLKYFTERIGGDFTEVLYPLQEHVDPAYWYPGEEAIAIFQEADVIFLNGAGYAQWLNKVSLPGSKLVNTSDALHGQFIEIEGQTTHTHGPEGEHAHGEIAFTTWLDPMLAIEHADAIKEALSGLLPENKESFDERFQTLKEDLYAIDKKIEAIVSNQAEQSLLFSHPVYQYLEKRYSLQGKSVHWEPDQFPDAEMWSDLENILRTFPAKWMVWEGIPMTETVEKLKEFGMGSIVFAPCGNTPEKGDYLSVMEQNIYNLQVAFTGEKSPA
jgi:zinc transport system substrate-binding protein